VIERERANLKTPQTLGNAFWHANSRQCFLACKLQPLFPGEHNIQTKLQKNTFKFHNFIYCCYTSRSSKIHKVHYVEFIFLLKSSKNRLQSTASRKLPDANENQFSRDRQKLHGNSFLQSRKLVSLINFYGYQTFGYSEPALH